MSEQETHRKVLELLGFEVSSVGGGKLSLTYLLTRNEETGHYFNARRINFGYSINATEADAWAQAPTLETLMPKLAEAMVNDDTPYFISCLYKRGDGFWYCRIEDTDTDTDTDVLIELTKGDDATTLPHAIGAIFVKMCEEDRIDGKAVQF